MNKIKKEQIKKDLDWWIEVFIIDPITYPLVSFLSNNFSKNALLYTFLSFFFWIFASILVFNGFYLFAWISYFLSVFWDWLDWKIARHNWTQVMIHWLLDILVDVIKNLLLLLALYMSFPEYSFYIFIFTLLILFYEFTYSIRLWTRLLFPHIEQRNNSYSMEELKSNYEKEIKKINNNFLTYLLKVYNYFFNISRKFRTYPYPTIIDAEFTIFVIFLFFPNDIILFLAILFLLPDTIISFLLTILLWVSNNKKC